MLRPTQEERANLIPNLLELGRIHPGDKLSVTSGRFKVQTKGFFSQSVARTFSKNSSAAYHLPIYRLFQIAVVDELWNGRPIPWRQINDAFAGLKNLRRTYELELEEGRRKRLPETGLREKITKVERLTNLIDKVEIFTVACADHTPETALMALPRGYARSRIYRMSHFAKQHLISNRQYAVNTNYKTFKIPFDTTTSFSPNQAPVLYSNNVFNSDRKYKTIDVQICNQFVSDALDRKINLKVQNLLPFDKWASKEATILYYLNNLRGDAEMLSEISLWCNQATLGGSASSFTFEGHIGSLGMPFIAEDGRRVFLPQGLPLIECNLIDIKYRKTVGLDLKLHDEVSEVTIHTHIELVPELFNRDRSAIHVRGDQDISGPDAKFVSGAHSPMQHYYFDLDFVIRRTGSRSFTYSIMNDMFWFETKPNIPEASNPEWLYEAA